MNMKIFFILFLATTVCSSPLYAKNKDKPLPPGLQKKVDRGEPLPPGWQKKLKKGEVLDYQVYRHGKVVIPVNDAGIITINVEGKLIRLIESTRKILDIL